MIKTNKKKNVGILFEAIVNAVVKMSVDNRVDEAAKLFKFVRSYFMNPITEVNKAYKIYSQLNFSTCRNEFFAAKFLEYLIKEYSQLDMRRLNREIFMIRESLSRVTNVDELLNQKIPNYKLYASFNALALDKRSLSAVEKIKCEGIIIEHCVSKKEVKREVVQEESDSTINNLAIVFALKKFRSQYTKEFTNEQYNILMKYLMSKDEREYARFAEDRAKVLIREITRKKDEFDDEAIREKIDLTIRKLNEIKGNKRVTDQMLTNLLLSYELKDLVMQF